MAGDESAQKRMPILDRIDLAAQSFEAPGHAIVMFDRSGVIGERYAGFADREKRTPVTAETLFPVASLTRLWSAVVLLQLVDEGKIDLDQAVVEHLPDVRLPASVQIRHLLSHSSQGTPGQRFHYDGRRYSVLSRVIEVAGGESFEQALQRRIITPLALRNTFLLGDDAAHTPRLAEFAMPYRHPADPTTCDIEFGHSASAGLVSTARDIATFDAALLRGELLPPPLLALVTRPFARAMPTGLGSFVQTVGGEKIVWGYGQYDCYGALNLMRAATGEGMVFLANNNASSDAPRLTHGDVTTSPIALAWLDRDGDDFVATRARLLRDVYVLPQRPRTLDALVELAAGMLVRAPSELSTPDLAMIHALGILAEGVSQTGQRRVPIIDEAIQRKADAVLAFDPQNPYAHYALASLHAALGDRDAARRHYRAIVDAPNASRNWYTVEAEAALATPD